MTAKTPRCMGETVGARRMSEGRWPRSLAAAPWRLRFRADREPERVGEGVGRLGRPLWRAPRHGREADARGREVRARSGMDATSRARVAH